MATASPPRDPIVGYLSTLESADHGYFGGYLMVSLLGRPLEFHCTAPVRPSRAQQILYGLTLRPYLLGEQIGGTLLREAKLRPELILTDQIDAFCLRSQATVPLVCLVGGTPEKESQDPTGHAADDGPAIIGGLVEGPILPLPASPSANAPQPATYRFSAGGCDWQLPNGFEADRPLVVDLLTRLAKHVELAEPFGRIHEAICEAQRIGERSQDTYGKAA